MQNHRAAPSSAAPAFAAEHEFSSGVSVLALSPSRFPCCIVVVVGEEFFDALQSSPHVHFDVSIKNYEWMCAAAGTEDLLCNTLLIQYYNTLSTVITL